MTYKQARNDVEERIQAEAQRRAKIVEEEELKELKEKEEQFKLEKEKAAENERLQEEDKKWEDLFVVEEQGDCITENQNDENILSNFIEYIKSNKIVEIQELADEFSLTNKAVQDRIKNLTENNSLQGVLDERGRFLCITDDEVTSLLDFINNSGKLSREELVDGFSKIVNLEGNSFQTVNFGNLKKEFDGQINEMFTQSNI